MNDRSQQPNIPEAIAKQIPPVARLLGTEIVELDGAEGTVTLQVQALDTFCNPAGVIQGGMLAAMMDEAMAIAAVASRGFTHYVPTLEMKISFLRPVYPGEIRVEGKVVHGGKSAAFVEAHLHDSEGNLAATASSTVLFRDRKTMFAKLQPVT